MSQTSDSGDNKSPQKDADLPLDAAPGSVISQTVWAVGAGTAGTLLAANSTCSAQNPMQPPIVSKQQSSFALDVSCLLFHAFAREQGARRCGLGHFLSFLFFLLRHASVPSHIFNSDSLCLLCFFVLVCILVPYSVLGLAVDMARNPDAHSFLWQFWFIYFVP